MPVPARRSPRVSSMSKHIGIPIKVLHDAEGHTVTIELKNGETYRGKLDEAEDNMNCHLSNCTKTGRDGRVTTLAKCAASRRGQRGPLHARPLAFVHATAPGTHPKPMRSSCSEVQGPELPAAQAGVKLSPHPHPAPPTLRSCFLRGSHVRFMVLPDILKNAPFFKKIDTKANRARSGAGKAKAAAKERTVGARPMPQLSSPPQPPPPQPTRVSAPSSDTRYVRTHPHTTGRRARCPSLLGCLLGRSSRILRSKSHPLPNCGAQVGPHPDFRPIENPAAGAAPAGATRPSTDQTG